MHNLLTVPEAVNYMRYSESSLAKWRTCREGGPKFIKVGRKVLYRREDLDAWLRAHTVQRDAS